MAWAYIAQRALTGEILHDDLPLTRESVGWGLNGAGTLKGTISPDIGNLRDETNRLILEEWGTLLYAEEDGVIRWGGILISSGYDGDDWTVEASEFGAYLHGTPYEGDFQRIGIDPVDAATEIWRHVQSFPDSNLGVQVIATPTPVRLGTPARTETEEDGTTREVEADPYSLVWWESKDCGAEFDSLATSTPFDHVEIHNWAADGESIEHRVFLGYPRLGRRRDDLAFIQGDNVISVITLQADGDDYANTVLGLGSGEGAATLRRETAIRDGRLRRVSVYSAKDVDATSRLDALIAAELERRRGLLEIASIDVVDHPNAPIASWDLGDDVLVTAEIPWLGEVSIWCRVTGWSLTGEHTASLTLARSDSYRYGG